LATYQVLTRELLGEGFMPGATEPNPWRGGKTMCCDDESRCSCPEKPKPEECTPEQIRECHGEVAEHPCEQQEKDQPPD
jgi:hypothetical protein